MKNIILPYIKNEIITSMKEFEDKGEKVVIVDAPTLIETKLHEEMDYVVLVHVIVQLKFKG